LDHPILSTAATFTEDPIDHVPAPIGFEYEPEPA
jgi:hypothetical protein